MLAGCIIIACIVSGGLTLYLVSPSPDDGELPRLVLYLKITDKVVYSNGTVSFTVICMVESFKNYPIPQGDLFHIEKVFICVEDRLIDFNSSLGEIKTTSEIPVVDGDFSLSANEKVSLTFQTSFGLHDLSHVYVGVLAVLTIDPDRTVTRWDGYTSIIPS
ncbi:MAG: hypothetical protein ACFFET_10165 [Candidatus Thorarchaeota archaeon]